MTGDQLDLVEWLNAPKTATGLPVLLHRVDPEKRMARFYRLDVERDLFGSWCLVREWGRIGRAGQLKIECFEAAELAQAALQKLEAAKARRGYSPVRAV